MSTRLTLRILISIIVAVVGGIICNKVLIMDGNISFISGLLLFVLMELYFLLIELDDTHSVKNAILSLTTSLKVGDHFSNYYTTLVLLNLRKKGSELLKDGIKISGKETHRIWTECITHMDIRLEATTYVSPKVWWYKDYSNPNIELRKSKARQGKIVSTLFIWDSPDELPKLKEIAYKQRTEGVLVSHASLQSIKKDPRRSLYLKRIGTEDFAVIDENWAFLHFLDNHRNTKSSLLTNSPDLVEACRELLRLTPGEKDFNNKGSGNLNNVD